MDKVDIRIKLLNARIKHLNKMGAIAATGVIVSTAERLDDEVMQQAFDDLKEMSEELGKTIEQHFAGSLLISLVAEVELYFNDVVKIILGAYPKKLGSETVKLVDVIGKPESEIVQLVVDSYMNSLMYKKPNEYIHSLCEIMSIEISKVKDLWNEFIEPKARRDLGIHNDWRVNETYLRKLAEAGIQTNANNNDDISPNNRYFTERFRSCGNLVKLVDTLLREKYS